MNNNYEHKGQFLNQAIVEKIICHIFSGKERPTYIGCIGNEVVEFHVKNGGLIPTEKADVEILIMWALNELKRSERAEKFSGNCWRIYT